MASIGVGMSQRAPADLLVVTGVSRPPGGVLYIDFRPPASAVAIVLRSGLHVYQLNLPLAFILTQPI